MPAPRELSKAGRALWLLVGKGNYVLRPDEQSVLLSACKTADMIERLESAWVDAGCPMVSTGSMGQEVIHPLVGEIRAQRAAHARLLAQLKLPDSGEAAPAESASEKARRAAVARWSRGA